MNRGERGINSTGFDSIHGLGYAEGLGKGAVLGGAAMLGVGLPPLIRGYAVYEGASPVLTRNTAALMEYITYQADPRAVFLAGIGAIIVLSGSAYSILASQQKKAMQARYDVSERKSEG